MRTEASYLKHVAGLDAEVFRDEIAREVFENFNAQIGEVAWHSAHIDGSLDVVSDLHASHMLELIECYNLRNPRVLEIGAYAHHSAQVVAAKTNGIGVSHDISKASLLEGKRRAHVRGFNGEHVAVAGDFHGLPFQDNWFDLVYVASSVHHTWRPWEVMEEMLRVVRAGGIVHINNEPIGRTGGLYAFRGNRADNRTAFENVIDALGLTATISSPFPGSRAEELFGIIENDQIPLHVYQRSLSKTDFEVLRWDICFGGIIGPFEQWLMDTRPKAKAIHERLVRDIRGAAGAFSERDLLSGFNIPTNDDLWPLCYHLDERLNAYDQALPADKDEILANLFGAALTATIKKSELPLSTLEGDHSLSNGSHDSMFKRALVEDGGVYRDSPQSTNVSLDLENAFSATSECAYSFGPDDWVTLVDDSGIETKSNLNGFGLITVSGGLGVLLLRTFSVATESPYYFDILVNGRLVYSHCVTSSESHLAKCMVNSESLIQVRLHAGDEIPLELRLHSRIICRFIGVKKLPVS